MIFDTTVRKDVVMEAVVMDTENNKKFAIIIDEVISNARDSCVVVYVKSIINGFAVNIFLSIIELKEGGGGVKRQIQFVHHF